MIEMTGNGTRHAIEAAPDTPLLYVLRNELALTGAKFGCGLGQCGACTVHLDGVAVRSCSIPVERAAGKNVVTVEGLAKAVHPLQDAFVEEQAAQCGYCTTGMIMAAAALLESTPQPSDLEIRRALHGNLCRCGSHLRVLRAIKRAARVMAEAH